MSEEALGLTGTTQSIEDNHISANTKENLKIDWFRGYGSDNC